MKYLTLGTFICLVIIGYAGDYNVVVGNGTLVSGNSNLALGNNITIQGDNNTQVGNSSGIIGDNNTQTGNNLSLIANNSVVQSDTNISSLDTSNSTSVNDTVKTLPLLILPAYEPASANITVGTTANTSADSSLDTSAATLALTITPTYASTHAPTSAGAGSATIVQFQDNGYNQNQGKQYEAHSNYIPTPKPQTPSKKKNLKTDDHQAIGQNNLQINQQVLSQTRAIIQSQIADQIKNAFSSPQNWQQQYSWQQPQPQNQPKINQNHQNW